MLRSPRLLCQCFSLGELSQAGRSRWDRRMLSPGKVPRARGRQAGAGVTLSPGALGRGLCSSSQRSHLGRAQIGVVTTQSHPGSSLRPRGLRASLFSLTPPTLPTSALCPGTACRVGGPANSLRGIPGATRLCDTLVTPWISPGSHRDTLPGDGLQDFQFFHVFSPLLGRARAEAKGCQIPASLRVPAWLRHPGDGAPPGNREEQGMGPLLR